MDNGSEKTIDNNRNPYKGPEFFKEKDAVFFKGRDSEADSLVWLLEARNIVLLYAQSGAGKTSLIHAGLLPKLRERNFEILPIGEVKGELPQGVALPENFNIYLYNLMSSLVGKGTNPQEFLHFSLSEFLKNLTHTGRDFELRTKEQGEIHEQDGRKRALLIDHLEELFEPYPKALINRECFFRQLAAAMDDDPDLYVLLTTREEYVSRIDKYSDLLPRRLQSRFSLDLPGKVVAQKMIVEPAGEANPSRKYDQEVAEKIVNHLSLVQVDDGTGKKVEEDGHVEPIQLQLVCFQLWESLDKDVPTITKDHLIKLTSAPNLEIAHAQGATDEKTIDDRIGEFIKNAMSRYYEQSISNVLVESDEDISEEELREWFSETLIQGGKRQRILRGETETAGIPEEIVDKLIDRRLIRNYTYLDSGNYVELIHYTLVNPILESNRKAQEEDYREMPWLTNANKYSGSPHRDLLLRGNELKKAQDQVEKRGGLEKQSQKIQSFLNDSENLKREKIRQNRFLLYGGAALLIFLLCTAALALWTWDTNIELGKTNIELEDTNIKLEETNIELEDTNIELAIKNIALLINISEDFQENENKEGAILVVLQALDHRREISSEQTQEDLDSLNGELKKLILVIVSDYLGSITNNNQIFQIQYSVESSFLNLDTYLACRIAGRNLTYQERRELGPADVDDEICKEFKKHISWAEVALQNSLRSCEEDIEKAKIFYESDSQLNYGDPLKFEKWAMPIVLNEYYINPPKNESCKNVARKLIGADLTDNYLNLLIEIEKFRNENLENLEIDDLEYIKNLWFNLPKTAQDTFDINDIVSALGRSCIQVPKNLDGWQGEELCKIYNEILIELDTHYVALTPTIEEESSFVKWEFEGKKEDIISITMKPIGKDGKPCLRLIKSSESDNVLFGGGDCNSTIKDYFLPADGNYLIEAAWDGEVRPYRISVDSKDPGVIKIGSDPIEVHDPTQRFWQFSGNAGDFVTIAMDSLEVGDPYLRLLSKDKEEIAANDDFGRTLDARIDTFLLPADGIYFIEAGWVGDAGPYHLSVDSIELGVIEVGSDPIPGTPTQRIWQFSGNRGDIVTIAMDSLEVGDPYLQLLSSDGEELAANDDFGGTLNARIDIFSLPADGPFLIYAGWVGEAGPYRLSVTQGLDLISIQPEIIDLTSNKIITGTLPSGSQAFWQFAGYLTQTVALSLTEPITDVTMTLYTHTGAFVSRQEAGSSTVLYTGFPETGDYILALDGTESGEPVQYSLSFVPFSPIPQECGIFDVLDADVYGGLKTGQHVILGRHRPVDGDDNWAESMAQYVGLVTQILSFDGTDTSGCPIVRVDIDGGEWEWRIRDMIVPEQ